MEGNEDDVSCEKIFDAPKKTHKSNVWHYFGFFKREGQLDKTHVICKQCRVAIKYAGNTTNLATHMKRRHGVDTSAAAPSSPPDSVEAADTHKNSRSLGKALLAAAPALCRAMSLCRAEYLQDRCDRGVQNISHTSYLHDQFIKSPKYFSFLLTGVLWK